MGALNSGFVPGFGHPVSTAVLAQLPLSLVPTFFVPLFIVLRLAALFQARQASSADAMGLRNPVTA